MRIHNNPKSGLSKTAIITKSFREGGYVVTILLNNAAEFGGLVAPKQKLGVWCEQKDAIKAVRKSCASFKGRRPI